MTIYALTYGDKKLPVTILEYLGMKRHGSWNTHESVKVLRQDGKKLEWNIKNLSADGGEDEIKAAIEQAKRDTVARGLTDARKNEIMRRHLCHVQPQNNHGRSDARASDWLVTNGVAHGKYQDDLTNEYVAFAEQLYIRERGITNMLWAMNKYVLAQTGVTGFMALLQAIPTMLATQAFAADLPGWKVTLRRDGTYEASSPYDFVRVRQTYIGNQFRRSEGHYEYRAEINLPREFEDKITAPIAIDLSIGLEGAAVLIERLTAANEDDGGTSV